MSADRTVIFFTLKKGYTPETSVLIDNFDTAIIVSLIININIINMSTNTM